MTNSRADRNKRSGNSGPGWRVILAVVIFFLWLVSSAVILYLSKTNSVSTPTKVQPAAPPPREVALPFSTTVTEEGKRFKQFNFPPTVSIGTIGKFAYRPVGQAGGRAVYSALDVVRYPGVVAMGSVKFPAEQRLSFVPGEMLAVNPSSLTRFRPGEIYDITMKRVQDIDIDVYLDACSQIKGVTRLDLSTCQDLTKDGAAFIDDYQSLQELHLAAPSYAMQAISRLASLKKVSSLGLYSRFDLYPILFVLRSSPNLKALKIQSLDISNASLNAIASLPLLEELSLSSPMLGNGPRLTATLKAVSACKHLKILSLDAGENSRPFHLDAAAAKLIENMHGLDVALINQIPESIKHN